MTDEQILQLLIDHGYNPKNSPARAKTFIAFARAIIAQVRAELKPVAYVMQNDLDELAKTGRRAVVIYNEPVSPLDVPLAIIPSTKE